MSGPFFVDEVVRELASGVTNVTVGEGLGVPYACYSLKEQKAIRNIETLLSIKR